MKQAADDHPKYSWPSDDEGSSDDEGVLEFIEYWSSRHEVNGVRTAEGGDPRWQDQNENRSAARLDRFCEEGIIKVRMHASAANPTPCFALLFRHLPSLHTALPCALLAILAIAPTPQLP